MAPLRRTSVAPYCRSVTPVACSAGMSLHPTTTLDDRPLVQILNPGVTLDVLAQKLQDMSGEGYQCAAAFVNVGCVGAAGIWLGTRFWCGRYLDVDNVIVDPQYRGAGIGQQLMDWVVELRVPRRLLKMTQRKIVQTTDPLIIISTLAKLIGSKRIRRQWCTSP